MIQTAAQMAVLIDGDNLAPDFVERLLRKAETLGQVRLKRVYRDWTNAGDEWKALIRRENIRPAKSIACTGRKNASDILLTIEAIDMLARGVRAFCLFSSDSDFTPLARRLRKGGAVVYGFGEAKTPDALKSACDDFIVLPPDARKVQAAAKRRLLKVMRELAADGEAVSLSRIGEQMNADYGFASLKKLIASTERVELLEGGKARLRKAV